MVEAMGTLLQERLREVIADSGPSIVHIGSHWLEQGANRIDAGYYSSESARATRTLESSGSDVGPLGDIVDNCFILGRFKRIYAAPPEVGWPYLAPTEAFQFRPNSTRWIAPAYAPKAPENHFVKEGWILVSASGAVGRPMMVGLRLTRFFLSHDMVRIVPSDSVPAGYLYAYLASWVGQALLTKDQYGAAIKHLEPHHVVGIPVPVLPDVEMQDIADRIVHAYNLREGANQLLDEAMDTLYRELELPEFKEDLISYLLSPKLLAAQVNPEALRAFAVSSRAMDSRLDASHYVPLGAAIGQGRYPPVELGQLCERIFHPERFKRNYVSEEHGVPFIQGSHIPLMRPYGQKHLASIDKRKLCQSRIHRHWVLITRSGTIGHVGVVSSITNGWAASEHLIRLVSKPPANNPGYIAAFLMTPFGQLQVQQQIYGAVVDEITPDDLARVVIPDAPQSVQDLIGNKVLEAFEDKDRANVLEDSAVRDLEARLGAGIACP